MKIPKFIISKLLLLGIIIVCVTLMIGIFWLVFPYKTADIAEPIPILNTNHQIEAGGKLIMRLDVTKYHTYPVSSGQQIICKDGTLIPINPNMSSPLPVGHWTVVRDQYTVPSSTPTGITCYFKFHNEYKVNPIRSIIKEWTSEEFTVI